MWTCARASLPEDNHDAACTSACSEESLCLRVPGLASASRRSASLCRSWCFQDGGSEEGEPDYGGEIESSPASLQTDVRYGGYIPQLGFNTFWPPESSKPGCLPSLRNGVLEGKGVRDLLHRTASTRGWRWRAAAQTLLPTQRPISVPGLREEPPPHSYF